MVKKKNPGVEPKVKKINEVVAQTPVFVDDFDSLVLEIKNQFSKLNASYPAPPLFTTDSSNLFEIFSDNIDESRRQYYKCNACRQFLIRYGGIVKIDENGETIPVMWDNIKANNCTELSKAIAAVYNHVKSTIVDGVFFSADKNFGVERNKTKDGKEWTHFHVQNTNIYKNKLLNAEQFAAEKKEDYKILNRSLSEFDIKTAEIAVTLLSNDVLFRSEKVLGVAQWFFNLHKKLEGLKNEKRENIIWLAVATAPIGFCHIRSSMIGTLLEDIKAGYSLEEIKNAFADKMNPTRYQRPQAAPTAGNIAAAEKIVEKLGIANSLKRRFAKLEEIQTIWKPSEYKNKQDTSGIFSHLKAKDKSSSDSLKNLTSSHTIITWQKFNKTILPNASKIEFYVPSGKNSYGAFVTAADPDASPILQWDSEDQRNPFSTYCYVGGSNPKQWNLKIGDYANVTAIATNPWMWFSDKFDHQGKGIIFIFENCRDTQYVSGAGFFPESLKSELHQIRSTLEAYATSAVVAEKDSATVCGLRFEEKAANRKPEEHIFRVTDRNGVQMTYKLDRWD